MATVEQFPRSIVRHNKDLSLTLRTLEASHIGDIMKAVFLTYKQTATLHSIIFLIIPHFAMPF